MKQAIKVTKLSFFYDDVEVIREINFQIKKGSITTMIGNTGGGKSTLVKLLSGKVKGMGNIEYFEKNINQFTKYDWNRINVVDYHSYQHLIKGTVLENLKKSLQKCQRLEKNLRYSIEEFAKLWKIDTILQTDITDLTLEEQSIVALAISSLSQQGILILDDAFVHIGMLRKKQVFKVLRRLNRELRFTILNVTHDINEIIYGDYAILLYQGKIVLKGDVEDVVKCEKILKKYHYELPFVAELSNKLRYYNLIDNIILDMNRMVNAIWK